MKQLEFCFSHPPAFYPCDCSRCRDAQLFSNQVSQKIKEEYESSEIYLAIQRARALTFKL